MNADELKQALKQLMLASTDLARLLGVSTRGVNFWISGEREVPGPVAAYLGLLLRVPARDRDLELARIREDMRMNEGMYGVTFEGRTGSGLGAFVLKEGRCYGADAAGVLYDGSYEPGPRAGLLNLKLRLTVPAGVELVTGVSAQPVDYGFDIAAIIIGGGNSSIAVNMPYGETVKAQIDFLREIPD